MGLKPRHDPKPRQFTYKDEKSHKFWEIMVAGATHTVRYGRVGSDGQSKTKTFESMEAAQADAQRLTLSKEKKGYSQGQRKSSEWLLEFLKARDIECNILYEEIDYYNGRLVREDSLRLGEGAFPLFPDCIVVDGDLQVDGTLAIKDSCGLFVFGDVYTSELMTSEGEVRIMGKLTATRRARFKSDPVQRVGSLETPRLELEWPEDGLWVENEKASKIGTTVKV